LKHKWTDNAQDDGDFINKFEAAAFGMKLAVRLLAKQQRTEQT